VEVKEPEQYELEVTVVGTALWLIALVVLAVFFNDELHRHHAQWWYGACAAGMVFGCYGMYRAIKRRKQSTP
jgi:membrane protein DedA with SNARE-associated domain